MTHARMHTSEAGAPGRSLTPLLGEAVLPDPWVLAVEEPDEAGAPRAVLYLVGTENQPMIDRRRRAEIPNWDRLPAAERARLETGCPASLCPIHRSVDLGRTWAETGRSLFGPLASLGYGRGEIWAPEVHRVTLVEPGAGPRPLFVGLYTTRRDGRPEDAERTVPIAPKWRGKFDFDRHLVIGQMVGDGVTGPFRVHPEPLVDGFWGTLDAHLFQDPGTGACRLFWKEDQTAHDLPSEIWMQEVAITAAGLRRVGAPLRILRAVPESWHGVTVEGMAVFGHPSLPPGTVYVLFSGNECFNDLYGIGCLKLDIHSGEVELLERPVLDKDSPALRGRLTGIGHPSIVALPAGAEVLVPRPGAAPVRVHHLLFAHAWTVGDRYGVETDRRRPYVFGLVVEEAEGDGWPRIVALP
jgi:hypothetical protein